MAEVDATRACVVCGNSFPKYKIKAVCSDACAAIRQRTYQSRSNARKPKATRQCQWCKAEFVIGELTGTRYCCGEHSSLAKKARDAAREQDPEIARKWAHKARWRDIVAARAKDAAYRRKARAERGRGDRSGEYARKRSRKSGATSAALLWIDAAYHLAYAEALEMDASISREKRALLKAERKAERKAEQAKQDAVRRERAKTRGMASSTLALKEKPEAYAAQLTRSRAKSFKRKTGKAMLQDGTAGAVVMLGGSRCLYCDCKLTDANRSHDHMRPLTRGGVHSAANIAPACMACNYSKGPKDFEEWVAKLAPKHRARAVKFFEKRNGPMLQMGLSLAA